MNHTESALRGAAAKPPRFLFLKPKTTVRNAGRKDADAGCGDGNDADAGCGFPHLIFPILISGSFEIIIFFIHLLEVLKTNEVVRNC